MEVEEASNQKNLAPNLTAAGKLLILDEMMKQKRIEIAKNYIRKNIVNTNNVF